MSAVALFVRPGSCYHELAASAFDQTRDARRYCGSLPVVAHPPCRAWGRLAHFAKPRPDEKDLARFAVAKVRRWGGVLEHPQFSGLWADQSLPLPGQRDERGGWTLPVLQSWWGHRAPKRTWLYIVGVEPAQCPPIPFELGEPLGRVENMCSAERERTPRAFASWLVDLAGRAA